MMNTKTTTQNLPYELKIMVLGAKEGFKDRFIMRFLSSIEDKLGAFITMKRKLKTDTGEHLIELIDCPEPTFKDRIIEEDVRKAHGFIFVYSLVSRPSFEALKLYKGFLRRIRGDGHIVTVIVGTLPFNQKAGRVVNQQEAKELAMLFDAQHIELMLSAHNEQQINESDQAHQVEQTFVILVKELRVASTKTNSVPSKSDRYSRVDTAEIQFASDEKGDEPPVIKAATLQKLIERATYDKYPSPDLVDDLIITYKAFTTPQELLKQLIKRYNVVPPSNKMKESEKTAWINQTRNPIRVRVIAFFKSWVEDHPADFIANPDVTQHLVNFVTTHVQQDHKLQAEVLQRSIKRLTDENAEPIKQFTPTTPPPPRIKNKKAESLLDFSGLECARQIALKEHAMYREIRPLHCLKGKFSKDSAQDNSISALIQQFNMTSSFLINQILNETRLKVRVKVVEKVIQIAQKCRELNNFSAVMMALSALENTAIFRLKETWKLVNKKRKDQFLELRQLTAVKGNYAAIRRAVNSASQPLVPYLGVYLSMLLFIEDGNPDANSEGLVNWDKWRMAAQVIKEIRQYQQTTYVFEKVDFITNYIYSNTAQLLSEEEAYRRSYQLEPGTMPPRVITTEIMQESSLTLPRAKNTPNSPSSGSRWAVGRVADKPTKSILRARREQGVDDARQSVGKLNTATGAALAALLTEWCSKARVAASVVSDVFAMTPVNLQAGIPTTNEEISYNIHYVSVLTGSKAVEGVLNKLMSGSISTVSPALYEWFSYMIVGTEGYSSSIVDAVHSLGKLNPPSELTQAIVDAICTIKIPPLDAKNMLKRRQLSLAIVDDSKSSASTEKDVNNSVAIAHAANVIANLEAMLRTTVTRDGCPKIIECTIARHHLDTALEKLKASKLPKEQEILRAFAEILSLITKEYQRIKHAAEYGLMGNWEQHIQGCFFSYLAAALHYCELLRDQLSIHHRRIIKMTELYRGDNNEALMSLGIGQAELKEQFKRDMSSVKKLAQQADEHEASSNHLIEWLLDGSYLSVELLHQTDLRIVQMISRCFMELKNLQRFAEGDEDNIELLI